ncbi:MAG TPA: hypothetical protein VN612_11490 [Acidobacteriaceae bacterium]|nr:hypothetical protein [Acidobacteriaceae bacterium]
MATARSKAESSAAWKFSEAHRCQRGDSPFEPAEDGLGDTRGEVPWQFRLHLRNGRWRTRQDVSMIGAAAGA